MAEIFCHKNCAKTLVKSKTRLGVGLKMLVYALIIDWSPRVLWVHSSFFKLKCHMTFHLFLIFFFFFEGVLSLSPPPSIDILFFPLVARRWPFGVSCIVLPCLFAVMLVSTWPTDVTSVCLWPFGVTTASWLPLAPTQCFQAALKPLGASHPVHNSRINSAVSWLATAGYKNKIREFFCDKCNIFQDIFCKAQWSYSFGIALYKTCILSLLLLSYSFLGWLSPGGFSSYLNG